MIKSTHGYLVLVRPRKTKLNKNRITHRFENDFIRDLFFIDFISNYGKNRFEYAKYFSLKFMHELNIDYVRHQDI